MGNKSFSVSPGKVAGRDHNISREYREGLAHVNKSRVQHNEVLVDRSLEEVYEELFGEAVVEYNRKQVEKNHPERQIESYLEKIRASKQEKTSYETVIQIGNLETNPASDAYCREESAKVYRDFLEEWHKRYPNFAVVRAAIHMDEATPHLHVEYVPWSSGNKRGLETKNGMKSALKAMGFEGDIKRLNPDMFSLLEEVAARYGIERVDMGLKGTKHLDVEAFKAMVKEVEETDYPYQNDPRLVELAEQAMSELVVVREGLEKAVETLEVVKENTRRPFSGAESRREIDNCLEAINPTRTLLQSLTERLRDALLGIPVYWRDHLINPVSDKLRAARERFGVAAPPEDRRVYRNPTLDEVMEECREAARAQVKLPPHQMIRHFQQGGRENQTRGQGLSR